MSARQTELHVLTLTIQRIFHLLRDGQYLRISVEALVVPVAGVAEFSIQASFNLLIEVINRIPRNLRFDMLTLKGW